MTHKCVSILNQCKSASALIVTGLKFPPQLYQCDQRKGFGGRDGTGWTTGIPTLKKKKSLKHCVRLRQKEWDHSADPFFTWMNISVSTTWHRGDFPTTTQQSKHHVITWSQVIQLRVVLSDKIHSKRELTLVVPPTFRCIIVGGFSLVPFCQGVFPNHHHLGLFITTTFKFFLIWFYRFL